MPPWTRPPLRSADVERAPARKDNERPLPSGSATCHALGVLPTFSLSLCMIVRNEEARLARCLQSVRGVVDELIVVDTGSTDATRDIAHQFGAQVASFEWCDDFAAARNHSIALARSLWVLVLDADEVIVTPDARQRLEAFAAQPGIFAGQIELENITEDGGRSVTLLTRLFARRPGVAYERAIHEQLVLNGAPLLGRPTGVRVQHDGYTAASLAGRDKLERNERLLRRRLESGASDGYDWYQLGRTLEVAGRFADALAAYEHAVELARDEDPHLPHLFESAATCLRSLGRSRQALTWLSQVEALFPERADMVFIIALLALDVGELQRAESGFQRCLELGRGALRPTSAESSWAARTTAPAHNLGVLYECTGRIAEARRAYETALSFQSDHSGARAGLERLRALG